jgi:hypothetical protein
MRKEIVYNLLHRHFAPRYNELLVEQAVLNNTVYNSVFTEKERELLHTLPEAWVTTTSAFTIAVANPTGWSDYLTIDVSEVSALATDFRRNAYYPYNNRSKHIKPVKLNLRLPGICHVSGKVMKTYERGDATITAILRQYQKNVRFMEELKTAEAQLDGLVGAFSTARALIDAWPECAPFVTIATKVQEKTGTAVVVAREQLNEMYDLPVEADA